MIEGGTSVTGSPVPNHLYVYALANQLKKKEENVTLTSSQAIYTVSLSYLKR